MMPKLKTEYDTVRCAAYTKRGPNKGKQCYNRTTIYAEMCRAHTAALKGLIIGDSNIPKAGRGLFTTRFLPARTTVCAYKGNRLSVEQYKKSNSGYGILREDGMVIDATSTQSSLGRWLNDCDGDNKAKGRCRDNNCEFLEKTDSLGRLTVEVVTLRDIEPGEELFVDYGDAYWNDEEDENKHDEADDVDEYEGDEEDEKALELVRELETLKNKMASKKASDEEKARYKELMKMSPFEIEAEKAFAERDANKKSQTDKSQTKKKKRRIVPSQDFTERKKPKSWKFP